MQGAQQGVQMAMQMGSQLGSMAMQAPQQATQMVTQPLQQLTGPLQQMSSIFGQMGGGNAQPAQIGLIGASPFSNHPLVGGSGASAGAGLVRAASLPGMGGSMAQTPLMANLVGSAEKVPMGAGAGGSGPVWLRSTVQAAVGPWGHGPEQEERRLQAGLAGAVTTRSRPGEDGDDDW